LKNSTYFVHRNPLRVFDWHPCQTIYFLPTAAKSKQKGPLSKYVLHPIIYSLLQVVMIRSRLAITQSPIPLGDCPTKVNKLLVNIQSRGELNRQLRC
jgi:hypothetical protein